MYRPKSIEKPENQQEKVSGTVKKTDKDKGNRFLFEKHFFPIFAVHFKNSLLERINFSYQLTQKRRNDAEDEDSFQCQKTVQVDRFWKTEAPSRQFFSLDEKKDEKAQTQTTSCYYSKSCG